MSFSNLQSLVDYLNAGDRECVAYQYMGNSYQFYAVIRKPDDESSQAGDQQWLGVEERLPEKSEKGMKAVLCINARSIKKAFYFPDRFKTIEFEDWDDYSEEDYPFTEDDRDKGCVWLRVGWYEELDCDFCDKHEWNHLTKVTHWMPLPNKPIKS